MNEASTADSVGDERLEDHPSDGDLYDFFASRGTKLDVNRRQGIAIHVALCGRCASTGEFIEETEEHLDAQLPTALREKDRVNVNESLVMIRMITDSQERPDAPANPPQHAKHWIPISIKDFFYLRWSTVTGRLQLLAGSLLTAVALSVLGYGGYNLGVSTISRIKRPTEQLPDRTNPSQPELGQANPQPNTVPPEASPSPALTVKTDQQRRLSAETHRDQVVAHLNPVIDLNPSREAQYRGGGRQLRYHPTIHARSSGPTLVPIRLPEGSPSGSYSVTIEDPYFNPVAPPATGESPDGKKLTVSLELEGLDPTAIYYLGVAREGGAPVHYQIGLQVTQTSPSRQEPRSTR